jgi:FtsP/CotA-like multicopper oxidase with cupredoxin domain
MPGISRNRQKEIERAFELRRQLSSAGLTKRELLKMGLMAGGIAALPVKGALAKALRPPVLFNGGPSSPPTRAFIEPMPRFTVKQPVASLNPAPTVSPNTAAGEGRKLSHQVLTQFPPQKFYSVSQQQAQAGMSPDLPMQTIWGFDGLLPGPLYIAKYGEPILVRNFNNLPPQNQNGGFGLPSVSTHLHNGHTPSESDGGPCFFFERGQFYDQHYPNVLAGFASTHPPNGDINESLSSLWYHDHRVDFTSQNLYKGLAGMYNLFNNLDNGDETNGAGFRPPSGEFDVNIMLNDKVFDPNTGLLFFDIFNLDGILGDKFLANGKIQPFFQVHPRRYRFRLVDGGPSRFYQMFLTDLNNLSAHNLFWQISTDGNLLPKPVQVESFRMGVAQRADIVIDFSAFAGRSIYFENRLEQQDGRGPTGNVLAAGQGNSIVRFDVVLPPVQDNSANPAAIAKFYDLPDTTATPRITRTFRFERTNGQWAINGRFMSCVQDPNRPPGNFVPRFRVQQNSVEHWVLQNNSGGWEHPIHIHFEEFQILSINGQPPTNSPLVLNGRSDVVRLEHNTQVELFFRFRDFLGSHPLHCHNVVHEDHAMMLLWEIATQGDNNTQP